VIALDTNVLVYARRREARHHREALRILTELAEGDRPWALPWPVVYEFLRVVTHPRVFDPPSELDAAVKDVEALLDSPSVSVLGEGPSHRILLRDVLLPARASGNHVHDGHIAALLLDNGVREIWTDDRGFARFRGLRVVHPFS